MSKKSIRTAMQEQQGSNPLRSVSYSYDATDQLTGESQSEATTPAASTRNRTISYDAMGNRTSLQHVLSPGVDQSVAYTHNKLNQMTGMSVTAGGVTTNTAFGYDAAGNMTQQAQSNGGSTYTYDDANRLIQVVQKNTSTGANTAKSEYVYDAMSRKAVSREYSWDATLNNNTGGWLQSEEKRRVYDGMDVVQERDATNTTKVNYTRSGNIGGLLARSDASGNYFFSYDGSGNVVGLTDAQQQIVAEYSYDAWGNALRATGTMASVNTYRYSTKEYQAASGLYDYGYRFYSPSLGRWINRDPIEEDGGLNLYAMVGNDPVNAVDAYGLQITSDSDGNNQMDYLDQQERKNDYDFSQADSYGRGDTGLLRGPGNGGRGGWTKPGHTRVRVPKASRGPRRAPKLKAPTVRNRLKYCRGPGNPGLPATGRFRFVPREGYDPRNPLPRGRKGGFLDRHGNEWTWDMKHGNHWDVQRPGGGRGNYVNVFPDGRIGQH